MTKTVPEEGGPEMAQDKPGTALGGSGGAP
jgi:hypothetical protein